MVAFDLVAAGGAVLVIDGQHAHGNSVRVEGPRLLAQQLQVPAVVDPDEVGGGDGLRAAIDAALDDHPHVHLMA